MTAPSMRLKLPAIRRYVQSVPWSIEPNKGGALLEVLGVHVAGKRFTRDELEARLAGERPKPQAGPAPIAGKQGAIQVINLFGVVAHRMDMLSEMSGGCSTLRVSDEFDAAMNDPNVSAIVFNVDSPGGSIDGVPELAKRIREARGKGKKLVAVANTLMASAAYWIGSQCDDVVATPSAAVGSIGVFMVHLDESGFDERIGLTYSLIFAGKHKVDGNPYEPLSDDARAALQEQVDEYYTLFVNDVAKGRKAKAADVRKGYGEGRCLTASQAQEAGLVDRIDTFDGVLASLGARNVSASGRPRQQPVPGVASATAIGAEAQPDPDELEPDEDELCPECGARLDGPRCTQCDYTTPDDTAAATSRVDAVPDQSPEPTPASVAMEQTMPQENAAPPTNGAGNAEAILAAERRRASEIRQIGAGLVSAGVQQATIDRAVSEGLTVDQASAAFNADIRARLAATPQITVGAQREAEAAFSTFGEQLQSVIRAGRGGAVDPRLHRVNAAVTGMGEGVGSEGGFFIEPSLLPGVIEPVYTEDPILSRVTRVPIGPRNNGTKYNVVDESARTNGARWGGIAMAWVGEGDTIAPSKPKLRQVQHDLKKLVGAAYLTEEQLEDAPQSQSLLQSAFQAELRFMLAAAVWSGQGGGQPLGFTKAGCAVSQAIEATQTIANSATFLALNLTKMLSRVPGALWGEVIWLYNQELLPYLVTAVVGTGSSSVPVFMGAGGLSAKPYDMILGRPAYPSEFAEAVGTPGDIACLVPSQYHMSDKGGPKQAMSAHVRFLNDEQVLKLTFRADGKPVWNTTLTPYKGANTRSPFILLAARS